VDDLGVGGKGPSGELEEDEGRVGVLGGTEGTGSLGSGRGD